jgi:hypothetical protein
MAGQEFSEMAGTGLLREVERIVVEGHRELFATEGRDWSPPLAYRWLRYEDPDPVRRLAEGVLELRRLGARFDAGAVEKASRKASDRGFLN